jgi:hypothetical protein
MPDLFRPPLLSQSNVQCPRFGQYGATDNIEYVGGRLYKWRELSRLTGAVSPFVVFLLVGIFTVSILGQNLAWLACCITIFAAVLVGSAGVWWQDKVRSSAGRVHHFRCNHCRNTWVWREGTPEPIYKQPQSEDL